MGYRVELEEDDLACKSERDARAAAVIIAADEWIHPHHLQVSAYCRSHPANDQSWALEVHHFQGDHWSEDNARKVWLAIAPHLADAATLEFQSEDFVRYRVRWQEGRVYEEYVKDVVWEINEEITAPEAEPAS